MVDSDQEHAANVYAEQLTTQLKKGVLSYLVLLICGRPVYTSEIIDRLHAANLAVVEGTIYPLLARLQKDNLLHHSWQESPSGPPRKYYEITEFGRLVQSELTENIKTINQATKYLQKEIS